MSLFVLDTDILSLWQHGHASVNQHVAADAADELAIRKSGVRSNRYLI